MSAGRNLLRVGLAASFMIALISCSRPPDLDDATKALHECPRGDSAWREAMSLAESSGRIEELGSQLEELTSRCGGHWEPHWTSGGVAMMRRDLDGARGHFAAALESARASDDMVGIARSADDAAWCAYLSGELGLGESLYREALEAATRAGRVDLRAFVQGNLAGLLVEAGRVAEARDSLEASIDGLRELGLDGEARSARFNQAVLELELGNAVAAEERLLSLASEARDLEDRALNDEISVVLGNLHAALDEYDDARRWYEAVSSTDAALQAMAHMGRGRVSLVQGRVSEARVMFETAERMSRGVDEPVARAAASFLAESLRRGGELERAVAASERVLAEVPLDDPDESAWLARVVLARALAEQGRAVRARALLEESLELINAQLEELDPRGDGLRYFRERRLPALALAELHARKGGSNEAQRVLALSTQLKARALRHTRYGRVIPALEQLGSIQAALEKGEILVDFLVSDRVLLVTLVSRDEASVHSLSVDRLALQAHIAQLRDAMTQGEPGHQHVEWLSERVVRPVAAALEQVTRVYLVPDAALSLVPFDRLEIERGVPLASRITLVQLPYAAVPPASSLHAPPMVLLAGVPALDPVSAYEELPWAALEISRIGEIWRDTTPKLIARGAFERAAFLAEAPRATVIHVASHAEASTRDPRLCGLVCSNGTRVRVDEISRLSLNEPLVVLSACRTGVGELIPGEGILGLGWAFLSAGARGLVTSLWSVDDAGSARLMIEFHERLASGAAPADALAESKRSAIATGVPAHVWSAYSLTLSPSLTETGNERLSK